MKEQWEYLRDTYPEEVLSTREENQAFYELVRARECMEKLNKLKSRDRSQAAKLAHARKKHKKIRQQVVMANIGLIMSMIKKTPTKNIEFDELVSEGMLFLLKAADKFDPSRGFKFSTYACRALLNAFSRAGLLQGRRNKTVFTDSEIAKEASNNIAVITLPQAEVMDLKEALATNSADLTEQELLIVTLRFGLSGEEWSVVRISELLGVSKERIRQKLVDLFAKLRMVLNTSEE